MLFLNKLLYNLSVSRPLSVGQSCIQVMINIVFCHCSHFDAALINLRLCHLPGCSSVMSSGLGPGVLLEHLSAFLCINNSPCLNRAACGEISNPLSARAMFVLVPATTLSLSLSYFNAWPSFYPSLIRFFPVSVIFFSDGSPHCRAPSPLRTPPSCGRPIGCRLPAKHATALCFYPT